MKNRDLKRFSREGVGIFFASEPDYLYDKIKMINKRWLMLGRYI